MGQHHPDRVAEASALTLQAPWCALRGADLLLRLRVRPRASPEGIGGVRDGRLLVRVSAAPVEGAANERLMRILSRELAVPLAMLILTRGVTSRDKDVLVRAAAARHAELVTRFAARAS
jgi:uncharacterized protein YggU (UPF0235/DUF167 family)